VPHSRRAFSRARRTTLAIVSASIAGLLVPLLTAPAALAVESDLPSVIAALGDSITRAPLTEGPTMGTGVNSWATGTSPDVRSHLLRIDDLRDSPATAFNLAEGGTTSAALADQARRAVAVGADYVTILSGSNNICQSTSVGTLPDVATFGAEVAAALRVLAAGRPNADILLGSIPSLLAVYQAGRDSVRALAAWAYLDRCPILLADPLATTPDAVSRRAAVESRVVSMNIALADACGAVPQCTYDEGAIYDDRPTLADLSTYDYFHPSISGQAKLAAATWAVTEDHALFHSAPSPIELPAPGSSAPSDGWVDDTDTRVELDGAWKSTAMPQDRGGSVSYNGTSGASYTLTFRGTQVSVVTRRTATSGIAEVSIDGKVVGRFDGYSDSTVHQATVFTSGRLPAGEHTITVTRTGTKSADSGGRNLILDGFLIAG
jgi:lysophospholipase L1-like esterase